MSDHACRNRIPPLVCRLGSEDPERRARDEMAFKIEGAFACIHSNFGPCPKPNRPRRQWTTEQSRKLRAPARAQAPAKQHRIAIIISAGAVASISDIGPSLLRQRASHLSHGPGGPRAIKINWGTTHAPTDGPLGIVTVLLSPVACRPPTVLIGVRSHAAFLTGMAGSSREAGSGLDPGEDAHAE